MSELKPRITSGNVGGLQHRNQPKFGDLWGGRDDFPLRDFIHRMDVIQPVVAILVALMHGIDAQISRLALRAVASAARRWTSAAATATRASDALRAVASAARRWGSGW